MPNIGNLEDGSVKKELKIIYVLDASGSMEGAKIGTLNDAMRSTIEELKKKNGEQAEFKIGVLQFDTTVKWITSNGVENLDDFFWEDIKCGVLTSLGGALTELDKSLSRNEIMRSQTGNKAPIIIFMSDGAPTDDWQGPLKKLAANRWYQQAIKIAFAIGEGADRDTLANVIGVDRRGNLIPAKECVISTNDLNVFAKMIQAVSVTASLASATSKTDEADIDTVKLIEEVKGDVNKGPVYTPVDVPVDIPDENDPIIFAPPGDDGDPAFNNGGFDVL